MSSFSYPAAAPTVTLTLHSPLPGQQDTQKSEVKIHVSMNNTIRTYKNVNDSGEIVGLKFREKYPTLSLALSFFKRAQGEYIKYVDEDAQEWWCTVSDVGIQVTERGQRCDARDFGVLELTIQRWING